MKPTKNRKIIKARIVVRNILQKIANMTLKLVMCMLLIIGFASYKSIDGGIAFVLLLILVVSYEKIQQFIR